MKFKNKVFLVIIATSLLLNLFTCEQLKKRRSRAKYKQKSGVAIPKDGCVTFYTKCSFQGGSIELCEDVFDLKIIKTKTWTGALPASMKIGKYMTVTLFQTAKFVGKTYSAEKELSCFKDVGFKASPAAFKINHIRTYTKSTKEIQYLKSVRQKQNTKAINEIKRDRKALLRARTRRDDAIRENIRYFGEDKKDRDDRDDRDYGFHDDTLFLEKYSTVHKAKAKKSKVKLRKGHKIDELTRFTKFRNLMGNRILAIEQKLERIQNERFHPVVACWNSVIVKPGDTLLSQTKMVWNRTQFNKDPATFHLSDDRTTVEVMKKGLYRIDVKVTTNSGSNIQGILDINQTDTIRFNASSTSGNTQDASLLYYKDMLPNDNFSVFIGSTGSGPNNIITEPVNRLCIRKIDH